MPKKIRLVEHLGAAELERRYLGARDPVERSHYQIVWLLSRGWLTREVVEATGYGRDRIQQVARRYDELGPDALGDRRRANPGAEPLLDAQGREELRAALGGEPPGGGLWSGPKVAAWMVGRLGRAVDPRRGWEYLRRLGYTPKVPRPAHEQADPEERAAFPKG